MVLGNIFQVSLQFAFSLGVLSRGFFFHTENVQLWICQSVCIPVVVIVLTVIVIIVIVVVVMVVVVVVRLFVSC